MRLIDADELKRLLGENITVLKFNQDFDGLLAEIIDNAPTVEYSKESLDYDKGFIAGCEHTRDKYVREAHWFVRDGYPHRVYCSLCQVTYSDTRWEVWKDGSLPRAYCPNCGAKMLPTLFKNKEES